MPTIPTEQFVNDEVDFHGAKLQFRARKMLRRLLPRNVECNPKADTAPGGTAIYFEGITFLAVNLYRHPKFIYTLRADWHCNYCACGRTDYIRTPTDLLEVLWNRYHHVCELFPPETPTPERRCGNCGCSCPGDIGFVTECRLNPPVPLLGLAVAIYPHVVANEWWCAQWRPKS